jgi:transposase
LTRRHGGKIGGLQNLVVPRRFADVFRRRWVVERTFAWLNQFRRLRVRYEKRADIHEAFLLPSMII